MKKRTLLILGATLLFGFSGIITVTTAGSCAQLREVIESYCVGTMMDSSECNSVKSTYASCVAATIDGRSSPPIRSSDAQKLSGKKGGGDYEKETKYKEEEYYNSEVYKEHQEEIRILNEKIQKISEKYCYNYPESGEHYKELDNCMDNHICINYCGGTPVMAFDEDSVDKECILNESKFSDEENKAFSFLCKTNIINDVDINKANLHTSLTRAEMAKLISSYALKFLGKQRSYNVSCGFRDVSQGNMVGDVSIELYDGIRDACMLLLMGVGTTEFNPHGIVKRADFGTVLSRMLRGDKYDNVGGNWYDGHLKALKQDGIMNNIDPKITEQKARVLLMLYRNSKNLIGNSIDNIEKKPSDYYTPGMTEEQKKAFDEYYSAQNNPNRRLSL